MARGDAARAVALLAEALGLWRGEALGELPTEPFAQHGAARLEEPPLAVPQDDDGDSRQPSATGRCQRNR